MIFKISMIGLLAQSVYFVKKMCGTMRGRFNEIAARKKLGIKLKWFEPLDSTQEEKIKSMKLTSKADEHP